MYFKLYDDYYQIVTLSITDFDGFSVSMYFALFKLDDVPPDIKKTKDKIK